MLAQLFTVSVAPAEVVTPLTVRADAAGFAKSRIELLVTLRLPNVSVVPLSLSCPPARTMFRPESLKLAPRVRVDPASSVIVPAPVIVPLRRLEPVDSVRLAPVPNERAPASLSDPTTWLLLFRLMIAPVLTVIAVAPVNALATFVWSVPPVTATVPANEGFAAPRERVPVPSLVIELAEVPVIAPLIAVLEFPPTSRLLAPSPTGPVSVSVPESDWIRLAPETVTAPLIVLFPEMFSNAPANAVPVLLMLKLLARVTLFWTWTLPLPLTVTAPVPKPELFVTFTTFEALVPPLYVLAPARTVLPVLLVTSEPAPVMTPLSVSVPVP